MPTQHDRTVPLTDGSEERGGAATAFAVLRGHRGTLAGATARVVGLSGLAWLLLTAAIFALTWPVFTQMRNQRLYYQYLEDPYLHDGSDLTLVTLWTLPLFLLLLGIGSAALQTVCSRAVAAETGGASPEDPSRAVVRSRLRALLSVYALRGLAVWLLPLIAMIVAHRLTGDQLDTPLPLERGTLAYELVDASPAAALFVAALLRLSLTLAPAAAADGLGPLAALRRSWSLTWSRAGLLRVLALALPLAALTAGLIRLVTQLALPLRPAVRTLLEDATGNFFAAYYAGILAPVIVGVLVAAAAVLPFAYTAFAALHARLRPRADAVRPRG